MRYEVLVKKWDEKKAFTPVIEVSDPTGEWKSGRIEGLRLEQPDSLDELKIHQWLADYAMKHQAIAAAALAAKDPKPKVKRGLIDATKTDKARKVAEGKTGSIADDADDADPFTANMLALGK